MKKIIGIILISVISLFILAGYTNTVSSDTRLEGPESIFEYVTPEDCLSYDFYVVYHKKTKVMYVVSDNPKNAGNFTLLVDEEGKPLLYEED